MKTNTHQQHNMSPIRSSLLFLTPEEREVQRIQLNIQDRLRIGQEITKTELKRMVASNKPVESFNVALADLEEAGIIETHKPKVDKGRRPLMVRYCGFASDRPGHTDEKWEEYLHWSQQANKEADARQGIGPAIISGVVQTPPPQTRTDRITYSQYLAGKR